MNIVTKQTRKKNTGAERREWDGKTLTMGNRTRNVYAVLLNEITADMIRT